MGGGHIARCSALAEVLLTAGYELHFIVANESIAENLLVNAERYILNCIAGSAIDCRKSADLIVQLQPHFVVLDGYQFDSDYCVGLSPLTNLVCFDDSNDRGLLQVDTIINSLVTADSLGYDNTAPGADCLLGRDYTLLSSSFRALQRQELLQAIDRQHIVVCFGAADVQNRTLAVARLLSERLNTCPGVSVKVDIVCGGLCRDPLLVERFCRTAGFEFFYNYNDMAGLFARAGLAIAAPGSMLYELAYCGVPSIFAVAAENQVLSARYHQSIGWCQVYDSAVDNNTLVEAALQLWGDKAVLQQMAVIASEQVDGLGAQRIADRLIARYGVTQ